MKNTTPNHPNHQPKKLDKQNLRDDLDATLQKLTEMSELFAMIRELVAEDTSSAKHRIKILANLGQYGCEDWSSVIESMGDNLQNESSNYFH